MSQPTVETCSECGKDDLIIFHYRGKNYCHECFSPIAEAVNVSADIIASTRPFKNSDPIFWPEVDEETRVVMLEWAVANAFILIDRAEIAYAFLQCQFVHPNITDDFRKALGAPPLTPNQRSGFSKKELRNWHKAAIEYLKWKRGREI